jgi:hypothetical protein
MGRVRHGTRHLTALLAHRTVAPDERDVPESLPLLHQYRWDEDYMSVSIELVEDLMDLLRSYMARSWPVAYELVLQIDDFLKRPQARERLDAVRGDPDVAPDIVDALIALEPRV